MVKEKDSPLKIFNVYRIIIAILIGFTRQLLQVLCRNHYRLLCKHQKKAKFLKNQV